MKRNEKALLSKRFATRQGDDNERLQKSLSWDDVIPRNEIDDEVNDEMK